MKNKKRLCPYHEDGLGWDACTEGFIGCQVEEARKAAKQYKSDCSGLPLKDGNYEGRILDFYFRSGRCCGTWNLYRNNKFVKNICIEEMRAMEREDRRRRKRLKAAASLHGIWAHLPKRIQKKLMEKTY
jgi:hypothetical protein